MCVTEATGTKTRSKRGTPTKNLTRDQRLDQLIGLCQKFVKDMQLNTKDKSQGKGKSKVDKAVEDEKQKVDKGKNKGGRRKRKLVVTPTKKSLPLPPRHTSRLILQVRSTLV